MNHMEFLENVLAGARAPGSFRSRKKLKLLRRKSWFALTACLNVKTQDLWLC